MRRIKTKIRILVTFCQLISSIGFNLNIPYPEVYSSFMRFLSVAGLNLFQFLPLNCVFDTNYYSHLLTLTLTPIGFVLVALLAYSRAKAQQKSTIFSVVLNLMYFVLPTCSTVVLTMFKVECFKGNETCYMKADYSIVHSTDGGTISAARWLWIAYAILMAFVYPFGSKITPIDPTLEIPLLPTNI